MKCGAAEVPQDQHHREDIAVTVNDEVRRRQQQNSVMKAEGAPEPLGSAVTAPIVEAAE
jgi:hypothetical protein